MTAIKETEQLLLATRAGHLILHRLSGSGHKQATGSRMGVTKEEVHQGNVRRKVLVSRNWSQQTTKNEPVVGRNFVHRA